MWIKFEHYFYKEDDAPKMVVSMDWFTFEDHWFQRYMFDRPMWKDEADMERLRLRNLARCKWFRISLNLFHYKVHIDFKLKQVGNVYHGRIMEDAPHVPAFVQRNREKKKALETKE